MKKYAVVLVVVVLFIFASVVISFAKDIIWDDIGRENLNLRTVLVNPDNPKVIYVGSSNAVLKSEDGGVSWRNILSVRGQNKAVNFLLLVSDSLYAATANGLFYSLNQGKDWKIIFKGKNSLENECTTLAVLPDAMYLGTKGGLFISKDQGHSWYKETAKLGNSHILTIAYNLKETDYIYIACADGVFKSKDSGQTWERTFVTSPTESGNGEEEVAEDQDEEKQESTIRYVSIDFNNSNYLYLATAKGVYRSLDRGQTWNSFSDDGLLSKEAQFLLVSKESQLYAVTKSGIFEYKGERWQELSLRLAVDKVNFLALDNRDNLYAATSKGLFKANLSYAAAEQEADTISLYSRDEPDINDVQQAAIKYAEVEPEKIIKWRKQAAKRALLPEVTVGMDRDKNKTISKNIWGIYSSYGTNGNVTAPGRYYIGPDDETNYNNENWGVSLTWDLGDLIWNDDQANIDVRSKLMVQLRDDILDEVTKLYFERLRVKMELDNLSIEDRKKRFEKELKMQELTAMLDALTGGYFSQQLKLKTNS